MRRRPTRGLIVVGLMACLVGAGVWWMTRDAAPAPPAPFNAWTGPVPVHTVLAEAGALELSLHAVGDVTPLSAVAVSSRVAGPLRRVFFSEGQAVEAGEVLAEVDAEPYRVALAEAEGDLAQAVARRRNAERELARAQALLKEDSIASQQVDAAEAAALESRAAVLSAEARVAEARMQLGWTRIEAPISGRLGLRGIDVGNVMVANDSELVSIVQMRPIGVRFSIPGHELAAVRAALREGRSLVVDAFARDGRTLLASGVLDAVDNRIDVQTGTVRMKAEFANEDEALFPHQFVNVRLRVGVDRESVTIPADAVQYGARGQYVYVIEQGKARVRQIEVGRVNDGRVAILDGLVEGEAVVLEGLDRLRDGREVVLDSNADGAAQ